MTGAVISGPVGTHGPKAVGSGAESIPEGRWLET